MKENKEETRLPHGSKCIIQDESIPFIGEPQLRSAEEILNDHLGSLLDPIPSGTLYGITNAMEDYASQFKSVQKEQPQLRSLQECKDQVAKECSVFNGLSYSYKGWQEMQSYLIQNDVIDVLSKRCDEAAELYASQFKSVQKEADEQESQEDAVFDVISIARMESMMPVQRYEYIKQNFNITRKPITSNGDGIQSCTLS